MALSLERLKGLIVNRLPRYSAYDHEHHGYQGQNGHPGVEMCPRMHKNDPRPYQPADDRYPKLSSEPYLIRMTPPFVRIDKRETD